MDWSRLPALLVGWALGTILVGAALWLLGVLPALPAELIGLGVAMVIAGVGACSGWSWRPDAARLIDRDGERQWRSGTGSAPVAATR